jgi:hypothetical protein
MNPIQKIVSSRLSSLMGQYESVEAIPHMGTRGQLREGFLIDFFKEVMPQRLSINSGIICDASGATTRQIDFIVTDESLLPSMGFEGRIAIVPIESALMTAEIKTTLTTNTLEQVRLQSESIQSLKFTNMSGAGNTQVMYPMNSILAFKSTVGKKTLIEWMKTNTDTLAICVINKFVLLKLSENKITVVEKSNKYPDFWETLVFIGKIYHGLTGLMKSRQQITPNWDVYMQGNCTHS